MKISNVFDFNNLDTIIDIPQSILQCRIDRIRIAHLDWKARLFATFDMEPRFELSLITKRGKSVPNHVLLKGLQELYMHGEY